MCVCEGDSEGASGRAGLGSHPCRPKKVGGLVAEALVPMETAEFRMFLALVLVQLGLEVGGAGGGGGDECVWRKLL